MIDRLVRRQYCASRSGLPAMLAQTPHVRGAEGGRGGGEKVVKSCWCSCEIAANPA